MNPIGERVGEVEKIEKTNLRASLLEYPDLTLSLYCGQLTELDIKRQVEEYAYLHRDRDRGRLYKASLSNSLHARYGIP